MFRNFFKYLLFLYTVLNAQVYEGFTLFSIYPSHDTKKSYLIANDETIINTWEHNRGPASMPYLLPDSSVIYPYKIESPSMEAGGVGGGIQKIKWDGTIVWDFTFSDTKYQHHHDIEVLPSGNILVIVWERKDDLEAFAAGRQMLNVMNEFWPPAILELETETGNIVWEWHAWNHLIQDVNSSLANFGNISEHPELIDINYGVIGDGNANADWMHINSIDYNRQLDQIVISSRNMNEFYIIDHSTTTEESATQTGGIYNKGGGILYRWGNPEVYKRGGSEDRKLFGQHDVSWIESGYPGGGGLIIYNNGLGRPEGQYSTVDVVTPIIAEDGHYYISPNSSFPPEELSWTYGGIDLFYSGRQSGAQRLANGNTLVTVAYSNRIFEVTLEKEIVWDYTFSNNSIAIPRARKYGIEYLNSNYLKNLKNHSKVDSYLLQNFPNPFNPNTTFIYNLIQDGFVNITIYDLRGRKIKTLLNGLADAGINKINWDGCDIFDQPMPSGAYFYKLETENTIETKQMLLLK